MGAGVHSLFGGWDGGGVPGAHFLQDSFHVDGKARREVVAEVHEA